MSNNNEFLSEDQARQLDRVHMKLFKDMPLLRSKPEVVGELDDLVFQGDWQGYEAKIESLSPEELEEEELRRTRFRDCLD